MNNKLSKPLLMGLAIFITIALVGSIFAGAASATTVNNHKKIQKEVVKKIQPKNAKKIQPKVVPKNIKVSKQKAILIAKLYNHYLPKGVFNYEMTIKSVSLNYDRNFYLIKVKYDYCEDTEIVMVNTVTGTSKINNEKWIHFNKLKASYVASMYKPALYGADMSYGTPKEITVHGKKLLKVAVYCRAIVPNPGPYKLLSWIYFDDKTGKSLEIEKCGSEKPKWRTLKDLDYMLAQKSFDGSYEKNILRNWYPE